MRSKRCWSEHTFSGVTWSEKTLFNMEFYNCRFDSCDFTYSVVNECQFDSCYFINCNVSNTTLRRTQFINIEFVSSKLLGLNWSDVSFPNSISFDKSNLRYNVFSGNNLSNLSITNCSAFGVFFQECNLSRSNFLGTDLTNSSFEDCQLNYADLSESIGLALSLASNDLTNVIVSIEIGIGLLKELRISVK